MWIVDGPLTGGGADDIHFEQGGPNEELYRWAEKVAAAEAQQLSSRGLRALPLKLSNCGLLALCHPGRTANDMQRIMFNRASVATSFDFDQVLSMEVGSMDDDTFQTPDGKMYFCVICLLRLGRGCTKSPTSIGGKEMVLVFPYVFTDPRNPLTHWAFVNSKAQARYLIRSNIREGSAVVPSQKAQPAKKDRSNVKPAVASPGHSVDSAHPPLPVCRGDTSPTSLIEHVRKEWAKYSVKQRVEMLSFRDASIFRRTLADVSALFASTSRTATDARRQMRGFPLLTSLEFEQKSSDQKVLSIAPSILGDTQDLFRILQKRCDKLFSGKLRRRRAPSEWSALFESPARDAERLEQRIAQLIEQKLWFFVDVPACKEPSSPVGKQRRRRRKTSESTTGSSKSPAACESPGNATEEFGEAASVVEPIDSSQPPSGENKAGSADSAAPEASVLAGGGCAGEAGPEVDKLVANAAMTLIDHGDNEDESSHADNDNHVEEENDDDTHLLRQCFDEPCRVPCPEVAELATEGSFQVPPRYDVDVGCVDFDSISQKDAAQQSLAIMAQHRGSRTEFPHPLEAPSADQALGSATHAVEAARANVACPPKFEQPPGLELDNATLVQRLAMRNRLLEQELERAGLKMSILQLLTSSLAGA
mmetsp:Transcript_118164/g.294740  ORF Transcript_118164/g.294740 Transcript_118164/m.294740 type:complete len:648 (+) Transcript_118164:70-2013(+)